MQCVFLQSGCEKNRPSNSVGKFIHIFPEGMVDFDDPAAPRPRRCKDGSLPMTERRSQRILKNPLRLARAVQLGVPPNYGIVRFLCGGLSIVDPTGVMLPLSFAIRNRANMWFNFLYLLERWFCAYGSRWQVLPTPTCLSSTIPLIMASAMVSRTESPRAR